MGRAVLWIQENGLSHDPSALQKYVVHINKEKKSKPPKKK